MIILINLFITYALWIYYSSVMVWVPEYVSVCVYCVHWYKCASACVWLRACVRVCVRMCLLNRTPRSRWQYFFFFFFVALLWDSVWCRAPPSQQSMAYDIIYMKIVLCIRRLTFWLNYINLIPLHDNKWIFFKHQDNNIQIISAILMSRFRVKWTKVIKRKKKKNENGIILGNFVIVWW